MGRPHSRVAIQRGGDFCRLDAEPAQLHLRVHPSQELDIAVGQVACPVAGFVEARLRVVAEWVRNKFLGAQVGSIQIALGYPHAADVQLTGYAHRHRLQVRI